MENNTKIQDSCQSLQTVVSDSILRYCFGNEIKKTWFISKNLKCFLPKGSRLLLKIEGVETTKQLSSCNLPQKGDVVSDIDGLHVLIKKISWV